MSRQSTTAHRAVTELISHRAARYAANAAVAGGPYIHLSRVFSALVDALSAPDPAAQVRTVAGSASPGIAEVIGDIANILESR